ncbi:ankyrin repeat-containing domain protein [Trichoderma sp. SZMC 28012]
MFFAACLFGLLTLPGVHADGWDDFSNNLATDLAPFLSLFGEQVTKQYLSESIATIDYFIFAMAPMGILTAIVSAIRVCGSPSLRAFIGRAQEGGGVAEAELCSSTSRDVCELYNNGGIARVFGRPKILEVVYDPEHNFADEKAGIYTFQEFIEKYPKKWTRIQPSESPGNNETMSEAFAQNFSPNLSLNVGIKRKPPAIFWAVAMIGMVLQAGVLVFAVLVTYYFRWEKDGSRPESYACPLTITGTLLLCGGIFLCAFLVGESTKEQIFRRNPDSGDKKAARESLYWVQPGGQVLGDQVFDAFCCSDRGEPLKEYITSWKNQSKISQVVVWAAVGISVIGFVMQFVGLRAIHSAVSVAQLGAIMLMSAARAALRMQRLKPEDNFLAQCPDEVVGHELDWLALRIGGQDIHRKSNSSSPAQSLDSPRLLWKFRGTLDITPETKGEQSPNASEEQNLATELLAYRTRLAQLTQSHNTQNKGTNSSEYFDDGMVEVREYSHRLALAIESAVNNIFSKSLKIEEGRELSMIWGFACDVVSVQPYDASEDRPIQHTIYLRLTRKEPTTPWKLQNKFQLEGLLGLWVWSLKSDPAVETSDSQSHFTISRSTEIPRKRIVSTNKNIETDLNLWLGDKTPIITEYELDPTYVKRGNPSITKWKPDDEQGKEIRFFGWHATETSQIPDSTPLTIMSAQTDSSLLSLCAQEVFGSFIASIFKITDDIGDINIQETPHFRLDSGLVTEMIKLFVEAQLGSNEDALLCILPTMLPRLRLSYTENAVIAAKGMANQHRRAGEWMQAETVLRWAWELCNKSQPHTSKDGCQNDQSIHADEPIQQAAIALGELYRWAMRDNETKEFGLRGIEWLSCQVPSRQGPSPSAHEAIIARYNDIAKKIAQQSDNASVIRTFPGSDVDLNDFLLYITLSTQMTNEDKGKALCSAAKRGWTEVVLALLESGAEPDFKDPAQNSRTALSQAAGIGSINAMKELIDWGAFPNSTDAHHRTPLSYASEMGHSSAVQILLGDQRVDPNAEDEEGLAPLLWAGKNGHEAVMKLLVQKKGVDLNAKDDGGETPLIHAIIHGRGAVVKLLAQGGADLNAKDDGGETPLIHAIIHGREAVVKLLAQGGADLNAKDDRGKTPLIHAIMHGSEALVKLLAQGGADLNAKDDRGETPLIHAIMHGRGAVVKLLVQKGADLNAKDDGGKTPLIHATIHGRGAVVRLLAQSGADLNAVGKDGYAALTHAVGNGYEAVVLLLAEEGADVNIRTIAAETPLMIATLRGHAEVVELLLQKGAELTAEDEEGQTALTHAVNKGHKEIIKLLVQSGADLNTKDKGGWTALTYAVNKGHREITELLIQTGADLNIQDQDGETALMRAAWEKSEKIATLLIQNGADLNIQDRRGGTALMRAARGKLEEIAALLIQNGADLNIQDQNGETALIHAAWEKSEEIVKLLIQNGADLNIQGRDGETALMRAAWGKSEEIVKLLVQSGADLNAKDNQGRTARTHAASGSSKEIVELLDSLSQSSPAPS